MPCTLSKSACRYLGRRAAYLHTAAWLLRKKKAGFKQQAWHLAEGNPRSGLYLCLKIVMGAQAELRRAGAAATNNMALAAAWPLLLC